MAFTERIYIYITIIYYNYITYDRRFGAYPPRKQLCRRLAPTEAPVLGPARPLAARRLPMTIPQMFRHVFPLAPSHLGVGENEKVQLQLPKRAVAQ